MNNDSKAKLENLLKDNIKLIDSLTADKVSPELYGSDEWLDTIINACLNIKNIRTMQKQMEEPVSRNDTSSKSTPEPRPTPEPTVEPTPSPTQIPMPKKEHDFDPETNICSLCGLHKTVEAEKQTPDPTFYTCLDCDHQFPISVDLNLPQEKETEEQKSRRL